MKPVQCNIYCQKRSTGRILASLLIVLMLALMIGLGFWQLERAQQKADQFKAFENRKDHPSRLVNQLDELSQLPRYQSLRIQGEFVAGWQIWLENRPLGNRMGARVYQAFQQTGDDRLILVNLGWMPYLRSQTTPQQLKLPAGRLKIQVLLDEFPASGLILGEGMEKQPLKGVQVSPYLLKAELEQASGQEIVDQVLLLDQDIGLPAQQQWQPKTMKPEKHRAYAFQWFTMAAVLAIIGIRLSRTKRT